jgi:hypothetical protein
MCPEEETIAQAAARAKAAGLHTESGAHDGPPTPHVPALEAIDSLSNAQLGAVLENDPAVLDRAGEYEVPAAIVELERRVDVGQPWEQGDDPPHAVLSRNGLANRDGPGLPEEPEPAPQPMGPQVPVVSARSRSAALKANDGKTAGLYVVLWAWAALPAWIDVDQEGEIHAHTHPSGTMPGGFEPLVIVQAHGPEQAKRKVSKGGAHPEAEAWIQHAAACGEGILLRAIPLQSWEENPTPARMEVPAPQLKLG